MGKTIKNRYEPGDLVIDFTEVVEYIGYEEHEEDNYHRLFSVKKGEYLSSAVIGPTAFKDSEGYKEIVRVWNLNVERHKEDIKEKDNILKEFCESIEIHNDYKIWFRTDNKISLFDKTELGWFGEGPLFITSINVNPHDIKNEEYRDFLIIYINNIIKKHLETK